MAMLQTVFANSKLFQEATWWAMWGQQIMEWRTDKACHDIRVRDWQGEWPGEYRSTGKWPTGPHNDVYYCNI